MNVSPTPSTRDKLLDAARDLIRAKGFGSTSVDDICAVARVTKGAFFHHFPSKEKLGIAAADAFNAMADRLFAAAPFSALADPRDRVFGYVEFRASILEGSISRYTCLLGTMVQEIQSTHPDLRGACSRNMDAHVDGLARDIAAAKELYAADADWTPTGVAYFIQSVLQGSFIFAKAHQGEAIARANLAHLRRYLTVLLGEPAQGAVDAGGHEELDFASTIEGSRPQSGIHPTKGMHPEGGAIP